MGNLTLRLLSTLDQNSSGFADTPTKITRELKETQAPLKLVGTWVPPPKKKKNKRKQKKNKTKKLNLKGPALKLLTDIVLFGVAKIRMILLQLEVKEESK